MASLVVPVILVCALLPAVTACGSDEMPQTATAAPPTATSIPESTPVPPSATTAPGPTAAPAPEATAAPTQRPAPTAAPEPTPTAPSETATATPTSEPTAAPPAPTEQELLAAYAAGHANQPGAIFAGDPMQLIGPPPHEGLMFQVPEAAYNQAFAAALFGVKELGIPSHLFIYTSDYYRELIGKANLLNPTELTSSGESIEIQHTCIDRNLPTCVLIQTYWAPNVAKRTNGQVQMSVTSFLELGISGADTLHLVADGTLGMTNIYTGHVAGEFPPIEVKSLWGLGSSVESSYLSQVGMGPDIDRMLSEQTEGGFLVNRNWFAGADQWFFSESPIQSLEDFKGKKVRTHAHALTDLILGLGGEPVFIPPGGHYLAVQTGTVDVGTTGALLAVSGRLHETTDYMTGPVSGFGYTNNVINGDFWNKIPSDLQEIIIEEGDKAELEGLRLAPYQNLIAVQINQMLGIQPIPFSEEDIRYIIGTIGQERIIPGWLGRLGYPGKNEDPVRIFNEHIGEYIGLKIEADGSIKQVPITKGPQVSQ